MSSLSRTAAALVTCLFLAGACAGNDEAAPVPGASAGSAAPSALPTAITSTATPAPAGDRVLARLEMPQGSDWMAVGAGSIWVRAEAGEVVRVDPTTNQIAARIPLSDGEGQHGCLGIGADDTAVWACGADGSVARIDPKTDKVVATVSADKSDDQGPIPVAFGHAWVLTGDGSTLAGIAYDKVDLSSQLGMRCSNLAATATSLWATCLTEGTVLRIDPATGQVLARVTGLDSPRHIAAAGATVWASFLGGIARIDEATGQVTSVTGLYLGPQAGLFAGPEDLWVRDQGTFLSRVNAETAEVTEQITVPEQSGGSALVAFGSVWGTAYNDFVLYRLSL